MPLDMKKPCIWSRPASYIRKRKQGSSAAAFVFAMQRQHFPSSGTCTFLGSYHSQAPVETNTGYWDSYKQTFACSRGFCFKSRLGAYIASRTSKCTATKGRESVRAWVSAQFRDSCYGGCTVQSRYCVAVGARTFWNSRKCGGRPITKPHSSNTRLWKRTRNINRCPLRS